MCWTHPFLPPLKPLSDDAAQQTFIDIAEDFHDNEDIKQLLSLTDNLPLAVDLLANLVDSEGCANVLVRWKSEKTSMLSTGSDRKSNLDASIKISLSSPRLHSSPGVEELLSLLSILPDGLSDGELLQSNLPIQNVLGCRAALVGTSLAYIDDRKRLKSLVPIREYMQCFHPASQSLIYQLQKHFYQLLDLYRKHFGTHHAVGRVNQITSNLGNLYQVLVRGLHLDNPNLADTIDCTISLNSFCQLTGYGHHILMNNIPALLPSTFNARLEVQFILEVINTTQYLPVGNHEQLIAKARYHFCHLKDPLLEGELYIVLNDVVLI